MSTSPIMCGSLSVTWCSIRFVECSGVISVAGLLTVGVREVREVRAPTRFGGHERIDTAVGRSVGRVGLCTRCVVNGI